MLFSCLQENLAQGLSVVSRFVSSRPQLPILANLLFSAKQGKLELKATNLEAGITMQIGAKIEEEGEITVPAKTTSELIASLPAGKIEFKNEENNLKVSSQGLQATINGLSATEFPPLPVFSGKPSFVFKKEEMVLPFSQVLFAAAQDESRPVLSGVKISGGEKGLVLAATDGFRLSVKKIPNNPKSNPFTFVLPARTLAEIIRLLTEQKEEEVAIELTTETNQAIFGLTKSEVVCRLLEGEFPNFEKIIPSGFATRVIFTKEDFAAAIKTASVFAREAANVVKFKINPSTDGPKFKIEASAPQVGEESFELEAKTEGEETEIAFNARFLQDLLAAISSEEIIFEANGPLSPGVFKIKDDESFLHLIMPVRVQV